MDILIDCLNDIVKLNTIYTIVLLASVTDFKLVVDDQTTFSGYLFRDDSEVSQQLYYNMNFNSSSMYSILSSPSGISPSSPYSANSNPDKPSLLIRMLKRLLLIADSFVVYVQSKFNEHTAASIASFSVLIIVLLIICCFIISLMREEERKIKEQYKKLSAGSSQSFLASNATQDCGISCGLRVGGVGGKSYTGYQRIGNGSNQSIIPAEPSSTGTTTSDSCTSGSGGYFTSSGAFRGPPYLLSGSINTNRLPDGLTHNNSSSSGNQLRVIELRRETYFGLVRLLKPGCRTIVLLCDTHSRVKLLTKFFHCIYPYRKNKTLQFAFLLIEKNIGWYEDVLKLALNEKREIHINPINCIGTVLVINGFKKYFSVYHASDTRCDPDEPLLLLEESLLDNLPQWLVRLFEGRASRYYVKYWPTRMR